MKILQEGPIGALVIAVVAVAGIIGCAVSGHAIPAELTAIASAAVGGALGITNPAGTAAASSSTPAATATDQGGAA